jgi:anthranilate phosphoribosyltransferase
MAAGKMPGVRASGVRETFERLESKCVLLVHGNEVKEASGVDQSCVQALRQESKLVRMLPNFFGEKPAGRLCRIAKISPARMVAIPATSNQWTEQ